MKKAIALFLIGGLTIMSLSSFTSPSSLGAAIAVENTTTVVGSASKGAVTPVLLTILVFAAVNATPTYPQTSTRGTAAKMQEVESNQEEVMMSKLG